MSQDHSPAPAPEKRASIGAQRNPASQEAILRAAEELLLETGLKGFSIEAVARRAKAGKPTIYRWWPSKAALIIEVYRRQKSMPPAFEGTIEEELTQYLHTLINFWKGDNGTLFRSIIAEAQADPDAARELRDYTLDRRRQSSQIIARAKARGEVAADVIPELIIEAVTSFAWTRLLTDRLDEASGEAAAYIHMVVAGIKAR